MNESSRISLAETAREARADIEAWARSTFDAAAPDALVTELCKLASSYLHQRLVARDYSPALISGWLRCDVPSPTPDPFFAVAGHLGAAHYWVVLGDSIIDITADQFNNRITLDPPFPPVIVQARSELKRHIPVTEDEPSRPEAGDWATAFRKWRGMQGRQRTT